MRSVPEFFLTKRSDGSRVTHTEASDAIMVAIAELLPPQQRGVFSDLEAYRNKLAGVMSPLPRKEKG